MRSQPWSSSFNGETQSNITVTMGSEVKLPPLSQVDCLQGPHRVDEDAVTREREFNYAKIRNRQKRIIKPQGKEREFGYGRRKRHLPDYLGSYPPLSQVPMGTNPILESLQPDKKTHHAYKRNIYNTRLLPISQVSCLISRADGSSEPKNTLQDMSKFHIQNNDSTYVKLAKSGGQRDLLHYKEVKPPLQRSLDTNYSPSSNGTLPALKSKSVQDPTWKPSQWAALSPIKKDQDHDGLKDK